MRREPCDGAVRGRRRGGWEEKGRKGQRGEEERGRRERESVSSLEKGAILITTWYSTSFSLITRGSLEVSWEGPWLFSSLDWGVRGGEICAYSNPKHRGFPSEGDSHTHPVLSIRG